MDIDQMMYDSLKYPASGWDKVLTLGAVLFLTIIIMVLGIGAAIFLNNIIFTVIIAILEIIIGLLASVIYLGYLFNVLKSSLKGKDKLPKFKKFPKMMINGLKVFVVNFAYLLVFVIIIAIFNLILYFIGNFAGMYPTYDAYSASSSNNLIMLWLYFLVYFIYLLVNMLLSLFFSLIISIAVANMAFKGKFKAAFNISDIREKIESIRWGKAILWIFAINFITTMVMLAGIVSIMLVIGVILLPLVIMPYMAIFEYRAIALLYKSA